MSDQMFVAIHHSMSVEDPESGTPPEVWAVSSDRQKLIDAVVKDLEERVQESLEEDGDEDDVADPVLVEHEGDTVLIKAAFLWSGGEYATYYVIDPAKVL